MLFLNETNKNSQPDRYWVEQAAPTHIHTGFDSEIVTNKRKWQQQQQGKANATCDTRLRLIDSITVNYEQEETFRRRNISTQFGPSGLFTSSLLLSIHVIIWHGKYLFFVSFNIWLVPGPAIETQPTFHIPQWAKL